MLSLKARKTQASCSYYRTKEQLPLKTSSGVFETHCEFTSMKVREFSELIPENSRDHRFMSAPSTQHCVRFTRQPVNVCKVN